MDYFKYDVIIIGTGISGMFTALNIDKNKKILMISKKNLGAGSSELAQGGIVSCIYKDLHLKDTLTAGSYYNSIEAIEVLQSESDICIKKLIEYGVNFDKDSSGNTLYTREGGHSKPCILHSKDITGKEIIRALTSEIRKRKNITIKENSFALDIVKEKGFNAVVVLNNNIEIFYADNIVLSTGGIGQVYKNTTNPIDITGDGIAIASRIDIKISDMEFVQFHPTGLYNKEEEKRELISEAVRGEGGVLRNIKGERFMRKYSAMEEMAPRDIVSISIFKELRETNSDYIYLDLTHLNEDYIKNRFPNIYATCFNIGVDISKEYIKVFPVQHYLMGGIETDLNGRTNLKGIFACGECARTGVHGANRLASNSLLEGIVFANRIAKEINLTKPIKGLITSEKVKKDLNLYKEKFNENSSGINLKDIKEEIKYLMDRYVGVIKNNNFLENLLNRVSTIRKELESKLRLDKDYIEVLNMVTISNLIIEAAIKREKNIGAHFKEDIRRETFVR